MNEEARLLFALWESVSDVIPTGERQNSAENMIRVLLDQEGYDIDLLHDAEGECPFLDRALAAVAEDLREEEDDLFDEIEEDD